MAADDPKIFDLTNRGVKKTSVPGTLTFVGLRPVGTILQVALLREPPAWGFRLLTFVGLSAVPVAGKSPLPLPRLLLALCSGVYAAKNIWWLTYVANEYFPPALAVFVSGYNGFMDTVCSLLHLWPVTSSLSPVNVFGVNLNPILPGLGVPVTVVVGSVLFAGGIATEAVSEYQRKAFKDRPENKGKLYTQGLWSISRHANYSGYTLWRAGYAMIAGGWLAGLAVGAFQSYDFVTRGVPALETYCGDRYGEQWEKYTKDTKSVLLPGIC